ncbi:hypothetical protein AV530_018370 [Patagioenas fasciata monilis]|uniref:Uncharacterized protein n=1 Tax=Patagioenas fasciata monilis TaxID=372326 RepID=A0A1V4JRR4_PATFA|nr:hypothetical protein AV530_018370 [Patagioenas fasciata monilis]
MEGRSGAGCGLCIVRARSAAEVLGETIAGRLGCKSLDSGMGWNNLNTSYFKHKLQTFLGAFKASHYLLCLLITC